MFTDKVLVITGGTGSFGNAVLRRFLNTGIAEIRIFSRDEKKQDDMRQEYHSDKLKFYIGDVRDLDGVRRAVAGADYVFHAAALKQVPSCEFYPLEAVRTNTLGAENVMTASVEKGVKRVVLLSTDKAVYPINAMGMSKALAERLMIARSRSMKGTVLCATRYGNVMASRGSVIPLFVRQIRAGLPLTVTDPNMTRFMMTLDEAVGLVLYALQHAKSGDVFVQKAPAATVGTLVAALKRVFQADNPVRLIGTRHGEKLHETLLTSEEAAKAKDHGEYYRVPVDPRGLDYAAYVDEGMPRVATDYTSSNTRQLDVNEMVRMLEDLNYVQGELKG